MQLLEKYVVRQKVLLIICVYVVVCMLSCFLDKSIEFDRSVWQMITNWLFGVCFVKHKKKGYLDDFAKYRKKGVSKNSKKNRLPPFFQDFHFFCLCCFLYRFFLKQNFRLRRAEPVLFIFSHLMKTSSLSVNLSK